MSLKSSRQIEIIDFNIHMMNTNVRCLTNTHARHQRKALANTVMTGKSSARSRCPSYLLLHWNFRDENLFCSKVANSPYLLHFNPAFCCNYVLQQGIEKTLLRARTAVFRVGINRDIDDMVAKSNFTIKQVLQKHWSSKRLLPDNESYGNVILSISAILQIDIW